MGFEHCFFFFSSRRRHTRLQGDWSSDVCSSDLADPRTYARLGGLASRILFAADTALTNPYTLYVVRRPEPHPAVRDFATWATHAGRERLLALRLPDGTPAFVRQPGECDATAKP